VVKKIVRGKFEDSSDFGRGSYRHEPQPACPYSLPAVLSMDELAMMADDELLSRCSILNSEKAEIVKTRFVPTAWEVEIAYVQRELQIRQDRRNKHREFSQQQQFLTRNFFAEEDGLPEFIPNNTSGMMFN
jgi:hypothetical protein